ncbi:delta-60 repeat domain-containing protein [Bdellovibrio bacteriovorus]|uniref:Uncharacterized protein n=1 Tax=Bdellovibrio bacteriovorus TaxID=959 RepID=A0A1Z3N8M4_BDEBC|nr:delta-60 repeat domain-containing protein [Bdellovibrio bacteriovorus]ASD63818.1 hypothetical protein B9G79_09650 [Bdellovibrio bacteriovorus]
MDVSGTLYTYLRAFLLYLGTVFVFAGCTLSASFTDLTGTAEAPSAPSGSNFLGQLSKTSAINWSYEFDAAESLERAILSASGDRIVAAVVNSGPVVMRIRPDGSVNTAFGNNGLISLPTVPTYNGFNAIYVSEDSNQNILVGWSLEGDWNANGRNYAIAIARFSSSGSLDLNFGNSGLFVFELPEPIYVRGILADASGYFIIGPGNFNGTGYLGYIFKIKEDGTFDTNYANNGRLIFNPPVVAGENFRDMHLSAASIAPDSSLYVTGQIYGDISGYSGVIYKVLATGAIDVTWGNSGLVRYDSPAQAWDTFHDIKIHDNKIYIAGEGPNFPDLDGVILRYNLNGTLDNTFDGDGVQRLKDVAGFGGGADYARILAIDSAGNIFIHGTSLDAADSNYTFIAKLLPNGSLDASYGIAGIAFIDFEREAWDYPRAAVFNSDESITVFNNSIIRDASMNQKGNLVSAKLLTSGTMDNTYGDNGFKENSEKYLQKVNLEPTHSQFHDGAFYAVYSAQTGNDGPVLVIHKTLPNGNSDTTFGDSGFFVVKRVLAAKMIISDGIYLLADYFDSNSNELSLRIFKYSVDGSPDSNFGVGGIMELPWDEDFETSTRNGQMAMGPDLHLYVTAYIFDIANGEPHTALWKVHSQTGAPWEDPQTSKTIKILAPADNGRSNDPTIIVDDIHNKVYLMSGDAPGSETMIIRRYNLDLSPDTDFNSTGALAETEFSGQFTEFVEINKIHLFNGDLYVSVYEQNEDFGVSALVKLTNTGAVDTSFGEDGLVHPGGNLTDRIWHSADFYYDEVRKNIIAANYTETEDENFLMSFSQINITSAPVSTTFVTGVANPVYFNNCSFSSIHGLHCIRNEWSPSKTETSLSIFK